MDMLAESPERIIHDHERVSLIGSAAALQLAARRRLKHKRPAAYTTKPTKTAPVAPPTDHQVVVGANYHIFGPWESSLGMAPPPG